MTELVNQSSQLPEVGKPQNQGGEILSSAVVVPRVLLMQGLSEAVAKRQKSPAGVAIAQGDIVRSSNLEVLGGPDSPAIEFIPISFTNHWRIEERVGDKFEFRGKEAMTAMNQDLPWTFEKDGTQWRRVKSLEVFALLPGDIAAAAAEKAKAAAGEEFDPDKALLPVLIGFRSTAYNAGKDVVTHFAKCRDFNAPGYVKSLTLRCEQTENEKGIFYIPKIGTGKMVPKDIQVIASNWLEILGTKAVQIDEEPDEIVDEAATAQRQQAQARAAQRF